MQHCGGGGGGGEGKLEGLGWKLGSWEGGGKGSFPLPPLDRTLMVQNNNKACLNVKYKSSHTHKKNRILYQ